MVLAFSLLFLSALFLVWQGTLPLELGLVFMSISLAAIIWRRVRRLQTKHQIRVDTRERKAKWGGVLTVVTGLSSLSGMACHLFITRNDELIVEDLVGIRLIPLSEISRMGLFYGRTLEGHSDREMMSHLKFRTLPRFSSVRAWLARNPQARKRLLLAIRFQKPLNEWEYSEMVVFSDLSDVGNLKAFSLRPEIAVKMTLMPKRFRGSKQKKKKDKLQVTEPLPWELTHHLAGKSLPGETAEILPVKDPSARNAGQNKVTHRRKDLAND
jgi:hypothetical protein